MTLTLLPLLLVRALATPAASPAASPAVERASEAAGVLPVVATEGGTSADASAPEDPGPTPGHLELLRNDWVYPGPKRTRARRGRVTAHEVVVVHEEVVGHGCKAGWGLIEGGGYLCLDRTAPTAEAPTPLPRLVAFDAPEPDEFWDYVKTGTWDRAPDDEAQALVPWIYGKRWRRWQGVFHDSVRDHERYREASEDQLEGNRKYHFSRIEETSRGPVLVRRNGQVVPMDGIHLYPLPRFVGRDLVADPLPPGRIAGWVHGYEGSVMRATPDPEAEVAMELEYHQFLVLDAAPADEEGRWWRVPDGLGPGVDGFVSDEEGVRRWSTAPAPDQLHPDRLWVDVDVRQQMLTVYEGLRPIYVTMVSTGKRGHSTPLGSFRIYDKMVTVDMMSREDAPEDDQYHVEAVPWSMHFWPRYALHGAYWHWGFGNRASHGCVNMSPRDAKWIFDRLHPLLPDGWHSVFEDPEHPGSVLRVRHEHELGRERREDPGERWQGR